MKSIGIICEYNPFHNGHIYHIQQTKKKYPKSTIVAIVNGFFEQRGEISLLTKEEKTKICLEYGIDLVVSLPFFYGTQSADHFAYGAISICKMLNIEAISFGSETSDLKTLEKLTTTKVPKDEIKKYLKKGLSYPSIINEITNSPNKPNDILGISYLKAIKELKTHIKPILIPRTNDYHDLNSKEEIISATNIRSKYFNKEEIKKYIPKESLKYLEKINLDNFYQLLKYKIISEDNLEQYVDVVEGIDNKLKKNILRHDNIDDFIESIKTKRWTYSRLKRMLIHILIGLKKEDINNKIDYIEILGFNEKGQQYLKTLNIPILNKKTKSIIYDYELKAATIYSLVSKKDILTFQNSHKPVKK